MHGISFTHMIRLSCYGTDMNSVIGWSWSEQDRPTFSTLYQELCQMSNINEGLWHAVIRKLLLCGIFTSC